MIGKAIRKYGEDKFYVELLEECLVEELNEREKYWIAFFNATNNKFGYNMSIGGHWPVREKKELNEQEVIDMFNSGIGSYNMAKLLHVHPYRTAEILKSTTLFMVLKSRREKMKKKL